jgi:hypothetical protein
MRIATRAMPALPREWQPVPPSGRTYIGDPDWVYCDFACYIQWLVRYIKVHTPTLSPSDAHKLVTCQPLRPAFLAQGRLSWDHWFVVHLQAHQEALAASSNKPLVIEEFGLTWW